MKIQELTIFLSFVALILSVSGCMVPIYVPPSAGDNATLVLETTVGAETRHAYVANSGTCDDRGIVKSPSEVHIPAGKQILVQQGFYSIWISYTLHCNLAVTFMPKAGERYVSSYQMDGNTRQCHMTLWRIDDKGKRHLEPSVIRISPCSEP